MGKKIKTIRPIINLSKLTPEQEDLLADRIANLIVAEFLNTTDVIKKKSKDLILVVLIFFGLLGFGRRS